MRLRHLICAAAALAGLTAPAGAAFYFRNTNSPGAAASSTPAPAPAQNVVPEPTYSFSTQPAALSAPAGGAAAATTARLTGTPNGTVTWSLAGPDGTSASVPAWLVTSGCGNTSCTVTASPGSAVPAGTYPATGSFVLKATDTVSGGVSSSGFSVSVQAYVPAPAGYGCAQVRDIYVNNALAATVNDCNFKATLSGVSSYQIDLKQVMRINGINNGGSVSAQYGVFEYFDGSAWVAFPYQGQLDAKAYAYNASVVTPNPVLKARYVRWRNTSGYSGNQYHFGLSLYCANKSDNSGLGCP